MILDINFQNLTKWSFWQQNRTVDPLVSLIQSNSITPLIQKPFQIDNDNLHIPKTKAPNIFQNLDNIDISNHHNFRIKQLENSSNRDGKRQTLHAANRLGCTGLPQIAVVTLQMPVKGWRDLLWWSV